MTAEFKIKGLDKFANGMRSLPEKGAKQMLGNAMRKAGKIFEERAKQLVPKRTGLLKQQLYAKNRPWSKLGFGPLDYAVTIANWLDGGGKNAFYGHLVEYGGRYVIKAKRGHTMAGKAGKKKATFVIRAGKIKPRPYMRPAFDQTKDVMMMTIVTQLEASIKRAWKKIGPRA